MFEKQANIKNVSFQGAVHERFPVKVSLFDN